MWRFKSPKHNPAKEQLQAFNEGEYDLKADEADLYKLMKLARTSTGQDRVKKQIDGMGFVAI